MKSFIEIKSLDRKQCPAELSPKIIASPPVSPVLPKDSKNYWFSLIIAGSSTLYKGDEDWSSNCKNSG